MSEVYTTLVASNWATLQTMSALRAQKWIGNGVRGRHDSRDSLCDDDAVVECIAHSENVRHEERAAAFA